MCRQNLWASTERGRAKSSLSYGVTHNLQKRWKGWRAAGQNLRRLRPGSVGTLGVENDWVYYWQQAEEMHHKEMVKPPHMNEWVDIVCDIYNMEKGSFSLRVENELF